MPSSRPPRASDVASEAKKFYIPTIQNDYAHNWPTQSYLFQRPLEQIRLTPIDPSFQNIPTFYISKGDPVDFTLNWSYRVEAHIPFICAANDKRPGGDWEIGAVGYEEKLCKRSTLSATLSKPGPGSQVENNYPIPSEGGIYSESVVVFRGPHDNYEPLEHWQALPVVSMPPQRWPKINPDTLKYALAMEREMVKNKIRSALRICAHYNHRVVVIGDFGLGNTWRNPPRDIAEIWREVILFDPGIRGRFDQIAFVFDDVNQSTTKLILDEISKKNKHSSKGKSKASTSAASSHSASGEPTDYEVFQRTFNSREIERYTTAPPRDPRYAIEMLTTH